MTSSKTASTWSHRELTCHKSSENKLNLQLNHPGGRIAPETGAQNAGGWLRREDNLPKCSVRGSVIRGGKIGVVECVKELKANPQYSIFPARDFRVLQNRKIGIEIGRCPEVVASLSERNRWTAAGPRRTRQCAHVETGFASRLDK